MHPRFITVFYPTCAYPCWTKLSKLKRYSNSLASRGAKFGQSSYYITYRNVRPLPLLPAKLSPESDSLWRRTSLSASSASLGHFSRPGLLKSHKWAGGVLLHSSPASVSLSSWWCSLFNDPRAKIKGSLAPCCSGVPLPAAQMRCWAGTAGMHFAVTYVLWRACLCR